MKLVKFVCRGLNGYLDFDLAFRPDVTFLIGINGSGKTSVLRATMALLGPDLNWLMNTKYSSVTVQLDDGKKKIIIRSDREAEVIKFTYSENGKSEEITISENQYAAAIRQEEEVVVDEDGEIVRYREDQTVLPDNIPFQAVRRLPTPIFLGLDRTTLATRDGLRSRRTRQRILRRPRTSLRTFLDDSVAQAEEMATDDMRKAHILRTRRAAELREEILLTLFSNTLQIDDLGLPTAKDLLRYQRSRDSLNEAFTVLGISQSKLSQTINPFFSKVIEIGSPLTKYKSFREITNQKNEKDQSAFFSWMAMRPRLLMISEVEELVNKFNRDQIDFFNKSTDYLDIMNSFFEDSHKKLHFREDYSLSVSLPSGFDADIFHLSSGERQLFVLITNLIFNNDQKRENVLIVDEPELSLHMKWQEMFVDALMKANPEIQLILATHSPSIILDRVTACVDLQ